MDETILSYLTDNFNVVYMFLVNVLTYCIIKIIDEFNGDKKVPTCVNDYLIRFDCIFRLSCTQI